MPACGGAAGGVGAGGLAGSVGAWMPRPRAQTLKLMLATAQGKSRNVAEAKRWLERSIEIKDWANYLAFNYLALVNQRLAERGQGP